MKRTSLSLALLAVTAQFQLSAATPAESSLVAHEWGTFTSVQDTDGNQLLWNPLQVTELPSFVYDLKHPDGKDASAPRRAAYAYSLGKDVTYAYQRMETPVIYFYSE